MGPAGPTSEEPKMVVDVGTARRLDGPLTSIHIPATSVERLLLASKLVEVPMLVEEGEATQQKDVPVKYTTLAEVPMAVAVSTPVEVSTTAKVPIQVEGPTSVKAHDHASLALDRWGYAAPLGVDLHMLPEDVAMEQLSGSPSTRTEHSSAPKDCPCPRSGLKPA